MVFTKDAVIFVLDTGAAMKGDAFELSREFIRLFLGKLFVEGGQTEVALIRFASENTNNDLYEEGCAGYEGIEMMSFFAKPSIRLLEIVDEIECSDFDADATDALIVAISVLVKYVGKKKFKPRIFLITAAAGEINEVGQHTEISATLSRQNISLNVVGLGFNNSQSDENVINECNLVRQQNEVLLRSLSDNCGGLVVEAKQAIAMIGRFRAKKVRSIAKFKGVLSIGNSLTINVHSYAKTKISNLPALKKETMCGSGFGNNDDDEDDDDDAEPVICRSIYRNKATNEEILDDTRKIKTYKYGATVVAMTGIDEASLGWTAPQMLRVLTFMPCANIKRHHWMGETDVITAAPNCASSAIALGAFVRAMRHTQRVAIVRYIKSNDCSPQLASLSPAPLEGNVCIEHFDVLYLNRLPFNNDIRRYDFECAKYEITDKGIAATRALVDALNIGCVSTASTNQNDGEDTQELLHPDTTYNPLFQRYYQALDKRLLDEHYDISHLDPTIINFMKPHKHVFEVAAPIFADWKTQFPLKKNEDKYKSKNSHWRENNATMEMQENQDIESDVSMVDIMSRRVHCVGNVDPLADYLSMLNDDASQHLNKATQQVLSRASQLVNLSYEGQHYGKAVNCIKAARNACIEHKEFHTFNQGMRALCASLQDQLGFWLKLQQYELTLINNSEISLSDVSCDEAQAFLYDNDNTSSTKIAEDKPVNVAASDLFDDFED